MTKCHYKATENNEKCLCRRLEMTVWKTKAESKKKWYAYEQFTPIHRLITLLTYINMYISSSRILHILRFDAFEIEIHGPGKENTYLLLSDCLLFAIRHLWWDVPDPKSDVPDLDPDSEIVDDKYSVGLMPHSSRLTGCLLLRFYGVGDEMLNNHYIIRIKLFHGWPYSNYKVKYKNCM